jgi:hypothetical protein
MWVVGVWSTLFVLLIMLSTYNVLTIAQWVLFISSSAILSCTRYIWLNLSSTLDEGCFFTCFGLGRLFLWDVCRLDWTMDNGWTRNSHSHRYWHLHKVLHSIPNTYCIVQLKFTHLRRPRSFFVRPFPSESRIPNPNITFHKWSESVDCGRQRGEERVLVKKS